MEGIFQGCVDVPVGGGIPLWSPFWPGVAAQNGTAYIMNAPNALFLAAALNTAISSTFIGQGIGWDRYGINCRRRLFRVHGMLDCHHRTPRQRPSKFTGSTTA